MTMLLLKYMIFQFFIFQSYHIQIPTVDRRSGFLPPSLFNTKNLGSGVFIPYFWDLAPDKNFTLTNNLYVDENPLFFRRVSSSI